MTRDIRDRLSVFGRTPIEVIRIALNMEQIEDLNPPKNPAKPSDVRYEKYVEQFGPSCWELDALDPPQLASIVETNVLAYRDENTWTVAKKQEENHRTDLQLVADRWDEAVDWAQEQG